MNWKRGLIMGDIAVDGLEDRRFWIGLLAPPLAALLLGYKAAAKAPRSALPCCINTTVHAALQGVAEMSQRYWL
jgi:hypothetical protein